MEQCLTINEETVIRSLAMKMIPLYSSGLLFDAKQITQWTSNACAAVVDLPPT